MEGKRVCVVLGGNGFIGSHIVEHLAKQNDLQVRVLDRFEKGPQFDVTPNVEVVTGSASDQPTLKRILKDAEFVVHSLGAANPFTSDADPYVDIANMEMSIRIFEACAKAKVKKVTFISSGGAVYGKVDEGSVMAEHDLPNPVSPYGICKLATENYLEYFKRKYDMDYVVCRLANPYGPRQAFRREQGVIPAFIHHFHNDENLPVLGDGTTSRDFIYIEDAAAMIADLSYKPTKHHVYNVGSGQQTSLNKIIKSLEEIFAKKLPVTNYDEPKTFLKNTSISVERYIQEFGMPNITTFTEGLRKTVEHMLASISLESTSQEAPVQDEVAA